MNSKFFSKWQDWVAVAVIILGLGYVSYDANAQTIIQETDQRGNNSWTRYNRDGSYHRYDQRGNHTWGRVVSPPAGNRYVPAPPQPYRPVQPYRPPQPYSPYGKR